MSDLKWVRPKTQSWPLSCWHEYRPIRPFPTARLHPSTTVPSLRRSLRRRLQSSDTSLPGSSSSVLVFAQLTWRESLRDIEACLNARRHQLYHLGAARPGQAQHAGRRTGRPRLAHLRRSGSTPVAQARRLYAKEPMTLDLDQTVYALDASVIDLCLSLYPWARFDASARASKSTRNWNCTRTCPRTGSTTGAINIQTLSDAQLASLTTAASNITGGANSVAGQAIVAAQESAEHSADVVSSIAGQAVTTGAQTAQALGGATLNAATTLGTTALTTGQNVAVAGITAGENLANSGLQRNVGELERSEPKYGRGV